MSDTGLTLRGITWNHSRGHLPMVATSQRYSELNAGISIRWDIHSLKAFEGFPLDQLASTYDLIVLDHPSISEGADEHLLLPLDEWMAPAFLADQAANSVGKSHETYHHGGHHWALAIDAATPVAFWREDLLAANKLAVPTTWEAVVELAKAGHVEVPAAPINCLMNLYPLCLAHGEEPFLSEERFVSRAVGRLAMASLRDLLAPCEPGIWERNPIASHEFVASEANTSLWYCPFAYGYSNYARHGYADRVLTSGEPPRFKGASLRTTLGGAGLAISALRPNRKDAVDYASFVASAAVQRGLYTHSGGQPGHRSAWLDAENNRITGGYFERTLPVLDCAFVRPRYRGCLLFQDKAGPIVHAALRGGLDTDEALNQLDSLYRSTVHLHALS